MTASVVSAISKDKTKIKNFVGKSSKMLIIIFGIVLFVVKPKEYIGSFSNGLLLFSKNVLPALFPFFFFTKTLSSSGATDVLGKLIGKPVSRLYKVPKVAGYVFVMSLLSGYPIGASITADLYKKGAIDKNDALTITAFCSTGGPLFILGTVNSFFSNYRFALTLLIANYLSAVINGFLYRGKTKNTNNYVIDNNSTDSLSTNIRSSIDAILMVGGFIALFNMVIDMLCDVKILQSAGKAVEFVLPFLQSGCGFSFLAGIVEMTRGCQLLSQYGINLTTACMCSFIISAGGIGIAMQSLSFLQSVGIKANEYLIRKFSQATISTVVAIPLFFIFFG